MVPRSLPKYTPEFRDDAVKLLSRTKRSLPDVARDLGVSVGTLRNWYNDEVSKKKPKRAPSKSSQSPVLADEVESPKEKIRRLERELSTAHRRIEGLEEDREILKKAAAFFVKESE
jgi:transposase